MTPEGVLELLREQVDATEEPVATSTEIAVDAPVTRRTILARLEVLEAQDRVASKEVGASARVWWPLPPADPPEEPPAEPPGEPSTEPPADPSGDPSEVPPAEPSEEPPEEIDASGLDDDLEAIDLPGSGSLLEERRDAVRACYRLLCDGETATRSDFIESVYSSHSAGYESERGWWNTIGKQGLGQLADRRDDLEAPAGEGMHKWRAV